MMNIKKRLVGHWSLAIAGLTTLAALALPAQAQEIKDSPLLLGQDSSVEVERVEQRQQRTVETEVVETEVVEIESTSSTEVRFTETVQTSVFQSIAQRSNVNAGNLRVVEVMRKEWTDGCLGLDINQTCSEAIVPGYLVAVTDGDDIWLYRTDLNGSVVYLDDRATEFRKSQRRVQNAQVSFPDVPTDYWAARYIRELAALDILAGYPDGLYRPNEAVTRAEFAAIIRRAFNISDIRDAIDFVDVDNAYWASSSIDEAYERGFLNAVSGREFRPLASLLRGDVLLAIANGFDFSADEATLSVLSDYDVSVSSAEVRLLLAALTQEGIVVNYPDVREFELDRVASRAEVAVMVYQTLYSLGYVQYIESPYTVRGTTVVTDIDAETTVRSPANEIDSPERRNCNQGIGNGAEGCDPGNSRPHGSSNDEGGRTPGNRP
ncbi:MAG: S-layer homology domain-containing protein [Elainellaceae cyanobacterium]